MLSETGRMKRMKATGPQLFCLGGAVIFCLMVLTISGCSPSKNTVRNGTVAFELKKYHLAISLLGKEFAAAKDQGKKLELMILIAESYRNMNEPAAALPWYIKAAESGGGGLNWYYAGLMEKQLENYESAINHFKTYAKTDPSGETAARVQIRACKNAKDWKSRFSRIEVRELKEINTTYSDFAPVMNHQELYFSSSRRESVGEVMDDWTGEEFCDLYTSRMNGNRFLLPASVSAPVNTLGHEASCALSRDGNEMYFTRIMPNDKGNAYNSIYYTRKNGMEWEEPVRLSFFSDTVNCGDPFLSSDGKMLFLVSDAPGGFGGKDIYYCNLMPGGWGPPVNAGTFVNTSGNERFPFLASDNKLYFSSDGLNGMGGLDLFRAEKDKTIWKNAENLLPPFNSGADDFAIYFDKYAPNGKLDTVLKSGYFTSNRKGGTGNDDLYRFEEKLKNLYVLVGQLIEKDFSDPENPESPLKGMKPLPGGRIELIDVSNDSVVGVNASNNLGEFSFLLQANRDYRVNGAKNGYFSNFSLVSTKGKRTADSITITIRTQIELEKIFTQKEIVIPNIYYDYDKADLRPESKVVLDSLLLFFNQNKGLTIEIGSHTDSRGSDEYNLVLSQNRAQSVVNYLISKGLSAESLQAKGYGETKPVNGCVNQVDCSEEDHQKNRRTTFRVVSMKMEIKSVEPKDVRVVPKGNEEEDELK